MTLRPGPDELPAPKACLVILDGWGLAPAGPGNAVELADTPVFDELWETYPHTQLTACGEAVGLPEGQMGNSEVGHLNLGAGAVVMQDLTRIDEAVADGTLAENEVLARGDGRARAACTSSASSPTAASTPGPKHLDALIRMAGELGVEDLVLHAFTDGRDTSPTCGADVARARRGGGCTRRGRAGSASVIGRYFAMDRDHREERTQQAVDLLLVGRRPSTTPTPVPTPLRAAYERDETDEFITADHRRRGRRRSTLSEDSVIAFNFRPDRMRQISEALAPPVQRYVTMAEYDEDYSYPVAFPPERPSVTMATVLADAEACASSTSPRPRSTRT